MQNTLTKKNNDTWLIIIVLSIVSFLPFFFLLFMNETLVTRDLTRVHIPAKLLIARSLHEFGSLPVWDSSIYGGVPFLSDPNLGAFHPFNLLFLVFPLKYFWHALLLFIGANVAIAATGMGMLLRSFRVPLPVLIGLGVLFAWSGPVLSAHSFPNILGSFAALPWYWFLLRKFYHVAEGKTVTALLLSAVMAFPCLAGDPQFSYLMGLFHLVYFVFNIKSWSKQKDLQKIILWLLVPFLAVLLAAVQIFPALALISQSSREAGVRPIESMWFSMHPVRYFEWIAPFFTGFFRPENNYWGKVFMHKPFDQPFVFSIYIGFLTTTFFLFSFFRFCRQFFLSAKERRFPRHLYLWLLTLTLFLLSLGKFMGPFSLYAGFYEFLPGWKFFRYPERIVYPLILFVFVLAGLEARFWYRFKLFAAKSKIILLVGFIYLLIGAIAVFFFPDAGKRITLSALAHTFLMAILTYLIFVFVQKRFLSRDKAFALLALLCVFDVGLLLQKNLWGVPQLVIPYSSFIQKIHTDLKNRQQEIKLGGAFRIAHSLVRFGSLDRFDWFHQLDPVLKSVLHQWTYAGPNINVYYGLANIGGYGSLEPHEFQHFFLRNKRVRPEQLFELLGVRYLPDFTEKGEWTVTVLPETEPYFLFGKSIQWVSSLEESESLVFDRKEKRTLVVSPQDNLARYNLNNKKTVGNQLYSDFVITGHERTTRGVRIFSRALGNLDEGQKYSVAFRWNERFDPYFAVYANGEKVSLLRMNYWATGTIFDLSSDSENLTLEFRYENPWLYRGAVCTALWIFLFCLVFVREKLVGHKNESA